MFNAHEYANIFDVVVLLGDNLANLNEKDKGFAQNLLDSYHNYHRLSEKQAYWVRELANRAQGFEAKKAEDIGSLSAINALFDKASSSLKRPAIVLKDDAQTYRLSVAGERSSNPGSINVTSVGSFENRTWYGRITQDGKFVPSRRDEAPEGLVSLLRRFAAEPAEVAAQYGRETGNCCFCARELTDARSVTVGYGPVCASRWNLPWGEAANDQAAA